MTVLQSLDKYYYRIAARGDADPTGYSRESISLCVWLNIDGTIANVSDLNDYTGKKPVARRLAVPQAVIRTSGVSSNFLWDKTAYTLGVAKDKAGTASRLAEKEHAAFKLLHSERLANTSDTGLLALLAFLARWTPQIFESDGRFLPEMLDKNVVFGLFGGRLEYIHDRPASQALIGVPRDTGYGQAYCLISGVHGPIERLHPAIKGVDGAQMGGARLVSYNADAFTSYKAEGGANAPTSELAAFRYGTSLNRLLDRGSANRLKIGDATLAFWADAEGFDEAAAAANEGLFKSLIEPPSDESEAEKLRNVLVEIKKRQPLRQIDPKLEPRTKFHILGLSPNAARLSVRYWMTDEFGNFAKRLALHYEDIDIAPAPWCTRLPSLQILLLRTTAVQEKFENIHPHLAGEVARAVLEGLPYPRTLLVAAIIRLRAGDPPHTGWHAAIIKACINRSSKEKLPVARNPDFPQVSYQLGRLFAVLEAAQRVALGHVNASIADRYYSAASATPARVFGPLLRGARHHVSGAIKLNAKNRWLETRLDEVMSKLDPTLPKTLKLEEQGRFAVGYYHERAWRGPGQPDPETPDITDKVVK